VTEAVIDPLTEFSDEWLQGSRTFWIEIQKSMKIDSKKESKQK